MTKIRRCILSIVLVFILVLSWWKLCAIAENTIISVEPANERGRVNKKVFGNNFLGYGPAPNEIHDKKHYVCADFGAGMWDPKRRESVEETIGLAREAGVRMARFPGGDGTKYYDWKSSIGTARKHFLYGLDEFLKTCEEMGAEPIYTISYFIGDEQDAADLVEYLNAPAGRGHKWADMRAENGHGEPYGVKYFEIGNEIWNDYLENIEEVLPRDYGRKYLRYYKKIKAIDPSVQLGVVFYTDEWNEEVMELIKDKVDFGIIHIYPHPDVSEYKIKEMDPKDIFMGTWGLSLLKAEKDISKTLRITKEASNKKIPLAVTEYNGGFWDDEPVPYRHCLGTALLNAELLRIFMKPKYNILMANYWNFVNEYWGMIANDFDGNNENLNHPYYKRPNFYVFQLYHERFGDILIDVKVDCASYVSGSHRVPYLSVNASKSKDGKKLYLMVVNKNMDDSVSASIQLRDFKVAKVEAWVLNGPSVESLNEKNHQEVGVKQASADLKNRKFNDKNSFDFAFEPHSLTAIEIGSE